MTDHTPAHVAAWRYVIAHGLEITPEQAGLVRRPAEAIAGGTPAENAALLAAILAGQGDPAHEL